MPLVSQAVVFDLLNGGDKGWSRYPPIASSATPPRRRRAPTSPSAAPAAASARQRANIKGGLGSASAFSTDGIAVGTLVVVNAIASAVIGGGPHFWAGALEENEEFGGVGLPATVTPGMRHTHWKGAAPPSTTIALVATDAALTKAQTKRLAVAAHGGHLAGAALRSREPRRRHDLCGRDRPAAPARRPRRPHRDRGARGGLLARAIARGVYEATALPFPGALPAWQGRFGRR